MAVFEETGATGKAAAARVRPIGLRPWAGLRRLGRALRRCARWLDTHSYSLSDFNERMIHDLGIEPIDLRTIRQSRGRPPER